jgi:Leucine-rich repeat (LRR) protein
MLSNVNNVLHPESGDSEVVNSLVKTEDKGFSPSLGSSPEMDILVNFFASLIECAPEYSSIRDDLGGAQDNMVAFLQNNKRCVFQKQGENLLEVLNLAGFSLDQISGIILERLEECIQVFHVQRLYLSGNALRSDCLGDIFRICSKDMQELFLDSNLLKKISWDVLVRCGMCLTHLDLSKNRLSGIIPSGDTKACTRLEWLDLSGNDRLESLPEHGFFATMPCLKRLDLHSCALSSLPDEISLVKDTLKHISLHSNALVEIPDAITECTHLTWMSLNSNMLKRLPESIGNLVNLERLSLHINRLEEIPESIGQCTHIEALSLHSNDLRNVPDSIGNLKECVRLSLYHNPKLGCVPNGVCCMSKLKELWMYDCGIERIDPNIGRLENLQKLWLDRNPFDVTTDVPWEALKQLHMLQELYLDTHGGESKNVHEKGMELKAALKHLKTLSI